MKESTKLIKVVFFCKQRRDRIRLISLLRDFAMRFYWKKKQNKFVFSLEYLKIILKNNNCHSRLHKIIIVIIIKNLNNIPAKLTI